MDSQLSPAAFDPVRQGIHVSYWSSVFERAMPWRPPSGRIVVVSPHPDDEVFGAGGLIASVDQPVTLVSVTDGERAYADWHDLGVVRRNELDSALRELDPVSLDVVRLGFPDSSVAAERGRLRAAVHALSKGASMLIVPFEEDGHPDHNVVGEVGLEIGLSLGLAVARYPIWRWHHGDVPDLLQRSWGRFDLSAGAQARKHRAMHCFQSQLAPSQGDPIIPPSVLAYFERSFEAFLL